MTNDKKIVGLALSGGGYRAGAYHIGTLRALHKLNIIDKIDVISSVSGGSIISAYYALNKDDYDAFESSLISKLQKGVMTKVWRLLIVKLIAICGVSVALSLILYLILRIGWLCIVVGFISFILLLIYLCLRWYNWMPISKLIIEEYENFFFNGATLDDLPDTPTLTINATNIATNLPFNFSKGYMGEYAYQIDNESIFDADKFPVSKAVMASSCVPYGFTPIRIDKKYMRRACSECKGKPEEPLLVDGGIYDNQGAHKLSMTKSKYHADFIIVSDAGNSDIKAKGTNNFITTLVKTSNMMMDRIKKLQTSQNIYEGHQGHSRYAYISLKWECSERLLTGFVQNLKDGNVHPDVWKKHGISQSDIDSLGVDYKSSSASIIEKLKTSINWKDLSEAPSAESETIAKKVGTNLVALSKDEIDALIAHAEWMTMVQVKLYLPNIL